MEEFLTDAGIHLLDDESVLIDNKFYIVGRRDASRCEKVEGSRQTPAQLTQALDQSKPIIFIDHQPKELSETAAAGVDLDLCGHTHDGQIFPGNLIIHLYWENSCGYLQKGSMHNIVRNRQRDLSYHHSFYEITPFTKHFSGNPYSFPHKGLPLHTDCRIYGSPFLK